MSAAPRPFSPQRTGDESTDRNLDAIAQAFVDLQRDLLLLRFTIDSAAIATSETKVAHGLGRVPRGRIILSQSADARVWDSKAADAQWLYLRASSAVTVKLLVA